MNTSIKTEQNFDQESSFSENDLDQFSFINKSIIDDNQSDLDWEKHPIDKNDNLEKEILFYPFTNFTKENFNSTNQIMDNIFLFNSQKNIQTHSNIKNFQKNNSNNTFYYPYNIGNEFLLLNNFLIQQKSFANNLHLGRITPTNSIFSFKDKNNNKLSLYINFESNSAKLNINNNKKGEESQITKKKFIDHKNEIIISKILSGEDKRTCLRLSSIPKRYSPFDVIKIIDKVLKTVPGKRIYKSIYVPLSKAIGKNIGYCFIDMASPKFVIQFYHIFNGKYVNNFKKKFWVVYSDIQNADIYGDDPLRKPIVFKDYIKDN